MEEIRTVETVRDLLEVVVDKKGVAYLLEELEAICYLKEEHLAHAWQDVAAAKSWKTAGKMVGGTAARIRMVLE